jgi:hypothetical protein
MTLAIGAHCCIRSRPIYLNPNQRRHANQAIAYRWVAVTE